MNKLGIYTHLLPALDRLAKEEEHEYFHRYINALHQCLRESVVFDCRHIPVEFIFDTGRAALHEAQEKGEKITLPYGSCYFEFDDESAVAAAEITEYYDDDTDGEEIVDFWDLRGWGGQPHSEMDIWEFSEAFGRFNNGSRYRPGSIDFLDPQDAEEYEGKVRPFVELINDDGNPCNELSMEWSSIGLMGVLTLLREKLVIERVEADPRPWLSEQRAKKGKSRKSSDVHVLSVNVPAIRYAASRSAPPRHGSHESPCLHWRRGHWRTLHRGSEFEKQSWVSKCLVGDPGKGFVSPEYRLVHHMPMPSGSEILEDAPTAA